MKTHKQNSDSAHVIAPPPFIYIGGLVLGLLLGYLKPLEFFRSDTLFFLAAVLIAVSVTLFVLALKSLAKANTNVDGRLPTTSGVASGPYHFSRNPIYLSMTLLYLGIALLLSDLWSFFFLVPVLLTIQYGVIKREEKYLTKKFGETYTNHKKSVRRWL